MKEDLKLTIQYLSILVESKNPIIKSSLTNSLIALYGKCYTDASKCKYPKLEAKNIFKTNSYLLKTHEMIIGLRHNYIAHRSETEIESIFTIMLIPRNAKAKNTQMIYSHIRQVIFFKKDLIRVRKLIEHVMTYIDVKIQKYTILVCNTFFDKLKDTSINKLVINDFKIRK